MSPTTAKDGLGAPTDRRCNVYADLRTRRRESLH